MFGHYIHSRDGIFDIRICIEKPKRKLKEEKTERERKREKKTWQKNWILFNTGFDCNANDKTKHNCK